MSITDSPLVFTSGAFSVLVNAIYFKAKWLSPFDKASNSNGTFYGVSGKKREVRVVFFVSFNPL